MRKYPYSFKVLDHLLENCLIAGENNTYFPATHVSGRNEVETDIDGAVTDKLKWIAKLDPEIIMDLGMGNDNITYYKVGPYGKAMLESGGFESYYKKALRKERVERLRLWMPLALSTLALIVSFSSYQFPKTDKVKEMQKQVDTLKVQQNNLRDSIEKLNKKIDAVPLPAASVPIAAPVPKISFLK